MNLTEPTPFVFYQCDVCLKHFQNSDRLNLVRIYNRVLHGAPDFDYSMVCNDCLTVMELEAKGNSR